jgi:outer membrane protein assembly factor BamD
MIKAINKPSFICLMLILFYGVFYQCSKNKVNLQTMTPEQQLEHANRLFKKKDYQDAKLEFTVIVLNNQGSTIIEEAQFMLGETYFQLKEYILAIEEYEKLIRSLPRSVFVDDAFYKIGLSYYELSPNYALDQEYTIKAINHFQTFIEEYPDSEFRERVETYLTECREKLAKKEYKTGELYRKEKYYDAALISFNEVLEKYYDSKFADDALYWKGICHYHMGELGDAERALKSLVAKYVQSVWVEKAEERLQHIQEELQKGLQNET